METVIIFGAEYLIVIVVAVAAVYLGYQLRRGQPGVMLFTIFTLAGSFIISRLAALLYYNPRPFIVKNIVPLVRHTADNGFPSDHTLLVAALAAVVWPLNRRLGVFLFGSAILVGLARVLAQVHHLIDVASSVIIAGAVALLVWLLQRRQLKPRASLR